MDSFLLAGYLEGDPGTGCAVIFLMAFLGIIARQAQRRNRIHRMAAVAGRWGGRLQVRPLWGDPDFEILHEGVAGRVDCKSGRNPWTRVRFNGRLPQRLRLMPEGFSSRFRRLLGARDVTIGEPNFDRVFWIETSDSAWVQEVLDRDVRRRISLLAVYRKWMGINEITVDLGPEGVTVRISRLFAGDPEALNQMIELAVALLRRAQGAQGDPGVDLEAMESVRGSACPVCGQVVVQGVTCPACRTPHHEDCWTYWGGCAVFACEGRPRKAA